MRTTLEIDDDVIQAARDLARLKNQGLGRAISDLARRGLAPEVQVMVKMEDGIPVLQHGPGAIQITDEMVRNMMEDE